MTLQLHHIFVFTSVGAPEAEDLVDAGLVEGSPNTHPGQGTANRRFFFANGFLELLWVRDEAEARSPRAAPVRLWDRWAERGRTANPFGLCFSSPEGGDFILPFPHWAYRPGYLPGKRAILVADGLPLSEPAVFALSWAEVASSPRTEPTNHPLGLCEMRSISVGLPDPTSISDCLRAIGNAGLVNVHRSAEPELVVEFSSPHEIRHRVPSLGLLLIGRPDGAA